MWATTPDEPFRFELNGLYDNIKQVYCITVAKKNRFGRRLLNLFANDATTIGLHQSKFRIKMLLIPTGPLYNVGKYINLQNLH